MSEMTVATEPANTEAFPEAMLRILVARTGRFCGSAWSQALCTCLRSCSGLGDSSLGHSPNRPLGPGHILPRAPAHTLLSLSPRFTSPPSPTVLGYESPPGAALPAPAVHPAAVPHCSTCSYSILYVPRCASSPPCPFTCSLPMSVTGLLKACLLYSLLPCEVPGRREKLRKFRKCRLIWGPSSFNKANQVRASSSILRASAS